jgi:hypothetical protein
MNDSKSNGRSKGSRTGSNYDSSNSLLYSNLWGRMEENIHLGTLDYDSSNDLENMRSVTAYSVYLNGLPIAIKSQMQDAVTLFYWKVS